MSELPLNSNKHVNTYCCNFVWIRSWYQGEIMFVDVS